jgi:hypothetical protein
MAEEDCSTPHELRRFAEYADPGGVVIAKHGRHVAEAGGVPGPHEPDEGTNDVEGWDMCHIRRVRWLSKREHRFKRPAPYHGRLSGCDDRDVLPWGERTIADTHLRPPHRCKLRAGRGLGRARPVRLARVPTPLHSSSGRAGSLASLDGPCGQ